MPIDAGTGGCSFERMASPLSPALRPAVAKDEHFLLRLYASTRAEELAATGWTRKQQDDFLRAQHAARENDYRLRFPQAQRRIVIVSGQDAGAVIVERSAGEIRLIDLALLPAHRRNGIGTALLLELQREARTANRPLRLQVLKSNPALRLYLRLGFSPTGDNGMYLQMEWSANQPPQPGSLPQ